MAVKILVTYASRTGSTAGVAAAIAQSLRECGAEVEVYKMYNVIDLSPYHAIVAGSPIHSGQWLPEAIDFLRIHRNSLLSKPFAAYLVSMTLSLPSPSMQMNRVNFWMEPVRSIVPTVSEGYFAGKLNISLIPSFRKRLKFRLKVLLGVWKEGDYRDWDAIKQWTTDLYPLLTKNKISS